MCTKFEEDMKEKAFEWMGGISFMWLKIKIVHHVPQRCGNVDPYRLGAQWSVINLED